MEYVDYKGIKFSLILYSTPRVPVINHHEVGDLSLSLGGWNPASLCLVTAWLPTAASPPDVPSTLHLSTILCASI